MPRRRQRLAASTALLLATSGIALPTAVQPAAHANTDRLAVQVQLDRAHVSPGEALSERFHASPDLVTRLNPSALFAAGKSIVVPKVGPPPDGPPSAPLVITVARASSVLTALTE